MKELIEEGKFRQDLYYRLAVYPIHIPPLRQREDDIIPLCYYFLNRFLKENQKDKKQFTQSALIMLRNYHWPGNVRELKNAIEGAVIHSHGPKIRPIDFFPLDLPDKTMELPYDAAKASAIMEFQRNYLKGALYRNHGNISKTAKEICISRQGLMKMMKELGLDVNA